MVIYREFETQEKKMQEKMREIILGYIFENACKLIPNEIQLEKLEINNSIIN